MQDLQQRKIEWNISLQDFIQWPRNNVGGFKVYRSLKLRFLGANNTLDRDKAFDYLFSKASESIMSYSKVFSQIKYNWLKDFTKAHLKEACYLMIQDMINNKTALYKSRQGNIQTPQFSATLTNQEIMLSRDVFTPEVKELLKRSMINKYKRISEDEAQALFESSPGTFEVIGWTQVITTEKELK